MEYKEIIIKWEGKYPLEKNENLINIGEANIVYQIYGDSHIYGRDVLLYIGKTERTVDKRIEEHLNSFFKFATNLSVCIGTVYFREETMELEIPESILIANHKPSFNKDYIHDISNSAKSHKIIIINNGNHLMLKSCCTNFWWVDDK